MGQECSCCGGRAGTSADGNNDPGKPNSGNPSSDDNGNGGNGGNGENGGNGGPRPQAANATNTAGVVVGSVVELDNMPRESASFSHSPRSGSSVDHDSMPPNSASISHPTPSSRPAAAKKPNKLPSSDVHAYSSEPPNPLTFGEIFSMPSRLANVPSTGPRPQENTDTLDPREVRKRECLDKHTSEGGPKKKARISDMLEVIPSEPARELPSGSGSMVNTQSETARSGNGRDSPGEQQPSQQPNQPPTQTLQTQDVDGEPRDVSAPDQQDNSGTKDNQKSKANKHDEKQQDIGYQHKEAAQPQNADRSSGQIAKQNDDQKTDQGKDQNQDQEKRTHDDGSPGTEDPSLLAPRPQRPIPWNSLSATIGQSGSSDRNSDRTTESNSAVSSSTAQGGAGLTDQSPSIYHQAVSSPSELPSQSTDSVSGLGAGLVDAVREAHRASQALKVAEGAEQSVQRSANTATDDDNAPATSGQEASNSETKNPTEKQHREGGAKQNKHGRTKQNKAPDGQQSKKPRRKTGKSGN